MYLVCDGGGTKTEYMLFDLSGHIHGFSKTQGTNAIFINPDAAADAVCGGISDCLQQAGIRDTDLNEICLFIPGFKNSANAVRDRFPKTRLMVLGDEYNAYYGALGEPGGIAVLSGTGSFAVCRDKKGSWISTLWRQRQRLPYGADVSGQDHTAMGSRQYQHLAANARTEAAAYGEYPVVKAGRI